jgi:hypothetical protein
LTTTIQLKRGTRANIDALASTGGLLEGEPLFITDENRFGLASSTTAYSASTLGGQWAAKIGQTSYISDYKFRYNSGQGNGSSLDWVSSTDGIYILKSGLYVCRATARCTGTGDTFIGISINGDRSALETRTTGAWEHDHSSVSAKFTESSYWGYLNAGELISAGAPAGNQTNIAYGAAGYHGCLRIMRID